MGGNIIPKGRINFSLKIYIKVLNFLIWQVRIFFLININGHSLLHSSCGYLVLYVFELMFVQRLLKEWMEHSQWFLLNQKPLKPDYNICIHITGKCEEIDNQYYHYGNYQIIHNVADFTECCRICKDDPECQNFSFGKEGQVFLQATMH